MCLPLTFNSMHGCWVSMAPQVTHYDLRGNEANSYISQTALSANAHSTWLWEEIKNNKWIEHLFTMDDRIRNVHISSHFTIMKWNYFLIATFINYGHCSDSRRPAAVVLVVKCAKGNSALHCPNENCIVRRSNQSNRVCCVLVNSSLCDGIMYADRHTGHTDKMAHGTGAIELFNTTQPAKQFVPLFLSLQRTWMPL